MTLTKKGIIDSIYEKTGITKKECLSAVESTFEIIKQELESGKPVMISGFGKWLIRAKNPRKGRNPQTGDEITISGRKVVTFKSSLKFKKEIQ
jgi:integration host factor subunit alpha